MLVVCAVAALTASSASAAIRDRVTTSKLVPLPGVVSKVETSDRYVSYFPLDGPAFVRVLDTKTAKRTDFPACGGPLSWGMEGELVLIPCPDRTATLLNVVTGKSETIQPASADPGIPGYADIGKHWMIGSIDCPARGVCVVYRSRDTGETRIFDSAVPTRDLDDPDLAPLRLCSPFSGSLEVGLGTSAMWEGRIIATSKGRVAVGTCGTGRLKAISPVGRRRGSRSPSLVGGWTAWIRDYCSPRMVLMSYDLSRDVRSRWRSRDLKWGKRCSRSPAVKTTRYGAVVTTWDHSEMPDSIEDSYYRVWFTARP